MQIYKNWCYGGVFTCLLLYFQGCCTLAVQLPSPCVLHFCGHPSIKLNSASWTVLSLAVSVSPFFFPLLYCMKSGLDEHWGPAFLEIWVDKTVEGHPGCVHICSPFADLHRYCDLRFDGYFSATSNLFPLKIFINNSGRTVLAGPSSCPCLQNMP